MADDKIRKGDPQNVKKKKAPPPEEDDDEEEEKPKKKKRRDADEDGGSDIGASPLSAVIPVGGSIFALASLWLSVFSLLLAIAGFVFFTREIWILVLPTPWMIAFLCGVVSFFTVRHKASYGSITGNMRAILGILISLVVMVMHGIAAFIYFTGGRGL